MKHLGKKSIGLAVLAVAVLAFGTIFVFAKGHRGEFAGGGFPSARMIERLSAKLGLSDEQKAQSTAILEESKGRIEPLMQALKETRKSVRDLGTDGVYNEAEVTRIAAEQAETAKQLFVEKEKTKAALFAILTPEQREQAKELHERMFAKGRGDHKRGRHAE